MRPGRLKEHKFSKNCRRGPLISAYIRNMNEIALQYTLWKIHEDRPLYDPRERSIDGRGDRHSRIEYPVRLTARRISSPLVSPQLEDQNRTSRYYHNSAVTPPIHTGQIYLRLEESHWSLKTEFPYQENRHTPRNKEDDGTMPKDLASLWNFVARFIIVLNNGEDLNKGRVEDDDRLTINAYPKYLSCKQKLEDMGPDVVKPGISSSFNDTEQQETLIL
ncbi:hypothetical protein Agabi119p4_7007 [Agaricus bisporus var. burnettii]|uniref:Uncharacterized protein n=1 Tax=Agaricus bisporus var. burnettii TaxID=192524 RepID=A0A8H7KE29_AGABI|nr:hypothetical protein Agabi119p4_7007 [Agaricus bisporus var. burnettii]